MSEGWQSEMSLTKAVKGTASKIPMMPQSQPQKSRPTVAATGPMLTREPMNFGIRKCGNEM